MLRTLLLPLALVLCFGSPANADWRATSAECTGPLARVGRGLPVRRVERTSLELRSIPARLDVYSPIVKEPVRPLESIEQLKIASLNLLKFYAYGVDIARGERTHGPKVLGSALAIADAILKNNLDIVVVQEVGSLLALQQLSYNFLGDRYKAYVTPGNDRWGMNVGFLVRKNLPFDVEANSHKGETWRNPAWGRRVRPLFTRDLPSLTFRAKGRKVPLFVVIGTHLKAQGPESDIASDASEERTAQVDRSAVITREYLGRHGRHTPVAMIGDFNGDISRSRALDALFHNNLLVDAFDVIGRNASDEDRITHSWIRPGGKPIYEQLDGVLLSRGFRPFVQDVYVHRWTGSDGRPLPLPRTLREQDELASDHYLLVTQFDFAGLRTDWLNR